MSTKSIKKRAFTFFDVYILIRIISINMIKKYVLRVFSIYSFYII